MSYDDAAAALDLEALCARLTLEEKVSLLTGCDFWSTVELPSIGLRSMTLSDGPSGVRGPVWDERDPSLNLPSASALSASWDESIAYRYGAAAASEARRKGVDWVLGPTINIHRSPLGGRHFEAFSEDPVLTGDLAASYVRGLQDYGVAATPKHYVANDFETERFTADVQVDDRTLREVYLLAFERAVTESRAWSIMSAYNSVNGTTATESDLLATPLVTEWGFDGVVVSDWTAVRSVDSAAAEQHLVMPGPQGPWGQALVEAVRAGEIDEAVVDGKVVRLLRMAARVGALEGAEHPAPAAVEDGKAFARLAATEGAVLLENRGELPWDGAALTSVAVIGNSAQVARTQGGGSATVVPVRTISPLEGLQEALPHVQVRYAVGAASQVGLAGLPLAEMTNPFTGEAGARVIFRDADGGELFTEDRRATDLVWFGGDAPIAQSASVELVTDWTPSEAGLVSFGCASVGRVRLELDGEVLIDEVLEPSGEDLGAALLSPTVAAREVERVPGRTQRARYVQELGVTGELFAGVLSFYVGTTPPPVDPQVMIEEAARVAAESEVAVVVVGTNAQVESEGFDRDTLALPGHQDALVAAVAAANPRTVVVVNAGSPVLMPWRDDVAAVLVGWFGGQEFGVAVADVLLGVAEPGGRLPTTWPATQEDVPVLNVTPEDGVVTYEEGIHVGYRAWLKSGATPAYWLGHGRGYTTFALDELVVSGPVAPGGAAAATVKVTNTGDRAGKQVVLLFAERVESDIDRPVRWLVGHAVVHLKAGATTAASFTIPARALAHWADGWTYEAGEFTLRAGTTAVDLPLSTSIVLEDS